MTIATINELENALYCDFSRIICNKNDPVAGNATVGGFHSFWRSTGVPAQPVAPTTTTAIVLNHLTTGAIPFAQQASGRQSYIGSFAATSTAAGSTVEIHDRLAHCAGFTANAPGTFTVNGFDFSTLTTNNLTNRIGDANYSDILWWMEWYTNTGADPANATVNVTYNDGSTGALTAFAIGGTVRASRMIQLNNLIPAADSGKYIRAVTSVTVGDTNADGNFGITATRYRCSIFMPQINKLYKNDWTRNGLTEIYNQSCLFPVCIATATTIGNIRLDGQIVHG